MTQSPHPVGYGRPPQHTQFQKGRSGNPGGKPGPIKRLQNRFDAALGGVLNGTVKALHDANPATIVEALARTVVLDALDDRSSAQKLLLAILRQAQDEVLRQAQDEVLRQAQDEVLRQAQDEVLRQAQDEEEEHDEDEEEEERFVYEDEGAREFFGERYGEFKARFERAVNANDLDGLADLAADLDGAILPASGRKAGR